MTVGIVGLGLIGGSFAKAYSKANHTVYAYDIDSSVISFSILAEVVKDTLTKETVSKCDLVLVCTYPEAAIDFIKEYAKYFGKDSVVIDCCGTKKTIVDACMKIASDNNFLYVGGHPMAGTQFSGFKYSRPDLFNGAPMVLVPPRFDDMALLDRVKQLLLPAGFGNISVTTAEKHDEIIAFTSQLAHVVSNAYIKSPTSRMHFGVSAGSYKDMTRVAWLNPDMWTELFLENKEHLINEINILINNLEQYKQAMIDNDSKKLYDLLKEGRDIKEEVDG